MPRFLQRMTGRPAAAETVAAVEQRYLAIGGASPLPEITRRQAAALESAAARQARLRPARAGPAFSTPTPDVADCLRELDGREVLALPLSPFSSRLTTQAYREALDAAGGEEVPLLDGWYADRRFVAAIATHRRGAGRRRRRRTTPSCSPPTACRLRRSCAGDPYAEQIHQTIAQLVPLSQPGDWRLGWQSKGLRGGEWLEPSAEEVVHELVTAGWRKLLVVPVGFVSDHVETLFDLDVVLRTVIEEAGMPYRAQPGPQRLAALHHGSRRHRHGLPGASSGRGTHGGARRRRGRRERRRPGAGRLTHGGRARTSTCPGSPSSAAA